ncbi:helix-turn-helix domain-containing protein [Allokutzneria albata]|uniref:Helix-turn-helix n=1 Tax=Allokutzneria albata TaxID=211114 RepID=A0A1G9WBZ4_ALLAB|nr:helix-turn-helix transcriptional regulator [Allokutzneria albata]SDM82032.1 Helix-turn-helix [Allokutzneria albata]
MPESIVRHYGESIEILPVAVRTKVFTARPSAVPEIQDYVRGCLSDSPLSESDNREVNRTILRVLLSAAGPAGKVQVSCRRYPDRVELDLLPSTSEHPGPAEGRPDARIPPPPAAPPSAENPPAGPHAVSSFAEWMAEALRREGITQGTAARELGVSVKTVSRWVSGETEPRLRELRRIQERFGDVQFR